MNLLRREPRLWLQALASALSLSIALPCYFALRSALPAEAHGLQSALFLLFIGAVVSFDRLFTLLLSFVFLKLWPKLEASSGSE